MKIFRCITYFTELMKEHLIAHIGVNDSYLKKILRDHALSVIQNARRTNTMKSYRTFFSKIFKKLKQLPAEDKYVGVYLLDLVKQESISHVLWLQHLQFIFLFEHL